MNHLCDDLIEFSSLNGRKFFFVKMHGPNYLHVWEDVGGDRFHDHRMLQRAIPVQQVEVGVLKKLNVWDGLTEKVKSEVGKITEKDQGCIEALESNARAARRCIGATMPKIIVCIQCGKKLNIAACTLLKRIEKISADKGVEYTVEDYVAEYKCQKCSPSTRGRKSNPEYVNLPRKLVCNKCKVAKPCAPSYLVQRAKAKNITVKELVDGYLCSNCGGPKRGRPSKK